MMISNEGSDKGAFGEKGDEDSDNASGAEAVHRDEDDAAETEKNEEEK